MGTGDAGRKQTLSPYSAVFQSHKYEYKLDFEPNPGPYSWVNRKSILFPSSLNRPSFYWREGSFIVFCFAYRTMTHFELVFKV